MDKRATPEPKNVKSYMYKFFNKQIKVPRHIHFAEYIL